MEKAPNYLDPAVLSELKGLSLKARLIVEGFVSGLHKSPHKGFSVEFAEHREYVPGDDLRYVDWKVYGKSDRYYLKQYEEETNFSCYLLVDSSESMKYRSDNAAVSKLEYAKYIAAALGYLVVKQQDAVGLATFDREITHFVQASSQPSHLTRIVEMLESLEPVHETSLGPVLNDLAERIKRRGMAILISDCLTDPDDLFLGLRHFRYRKHDVSILQIVDPSEEDFPFDTPALFRGYENGGAQMTDPRNIRTAYRSEFEGFVKRIRSFCRDRNIDHHLLRTDRSLDRALTAYLSRRMRYVGRT